MACETYELTRFNAKSKNLLKHILSTVEQYRALNLDLNVRQVHYRLVGKNIYKNTKANYKSLVFLITNARLAGLIDWDMIVDRGRSSKRFPNYDDLDDFINVAERSFRIDKWKDQDYYVEVQVEKQGLEGVIAAVCEELDVRFAGNKGYNSSSMTYRTAKRLRSYQDDGKKVVVLYLGDHDPSGIDMTRDVTRRLELLAGDPREDGGPRPLNLDIRRIALNIDQVRQYNLAENFVKPKDLRSGGYMAQFGNACWELDALDPSVLAQLVRDNVLALRDQEKWDAAVREEDRQKLLLTDVANRYRAGRAADQLAEQTRLESGQDLDFTI